MCGMGFSLRESSISLFDECGMLKAGRARFLFM
jgi:hypothetical protein